MACEGGLVTLLCIFWVLRCSLVGHRNRHMTDACCCVVVTHNKVAVGLRHADVMKLFHSDDVSNRPARKMSHLASYPSCRKAISLRGRTGQRYPAASFLSPCGGPFVL